MHVVTAIDRCGKSHHLPMILETYRSVCAAGDKLHLVHCVSATPVQSLTIGGSSTPVQGASATPRQQFDHQQAKVKLSELYESKMQSAAVS
jgi:hypothetical protein